MSDRDALAAWTCLVLAVGIHIGSGGWPWIVGVLVVCSAVFGAMAHYDDAPHP